MSTNVISHPTILQVPQGIVRQQAQNERLRKTKRSKSSGSVSKSIIYSSCDGDCSEGDDRKGQSTGSDASSTNVIFFKDITDSSAGSMEEHRRSLLRPGKRKSICSKLGLSRKVKVFKGPEGTDDSLLNMCGTERTLCLKTPDKPPRRRGRPPTPERSTNHCRPSSQKSEKEKVLQSRRPSTVGSDDTEGKYSDSIFGVFVKREEKMVKKRLVTVEREVGHNQRNTLGTPSRVSKKKSPLCLVESNQAKQSQIIPQTTSSKEIKLHFEVRDKIENDEMVIVEGTASKVEISLQRSKSTLKPSNTLKAVASKRSVHWEDEVVQNKEKGDSSDDCQQTLASNDVGKISWEMECAKRARRIRRHYENFRKQSGVHASIKDNLQMEFTSTQKTSFKVKKNVQKESNIDQVETIVQKVELSNNFPKLASSNKNLEMEEVLFQTENSSGNDRILNAKQYSSSESEILMRRSRDYYPETSDDDDNNDKRKKLNQGNRKVVTLFKDSGTDVSCPSRADELKTGQNRRRIVAVSNKVVQRRTSSPAICKGKDSKISLLRRKSSPGVDSKRIIQKSETSFSSLSSKSETSRNEANGLARGEKSCSNNDTVLYEQEFSKQIPLEGNKKAGSPSVKRRTKSFDSSEILLKSSNTIGEEKQAIVTFKECIKETEQCLERLKSELLPGTKENSEILSKIRAKLSKIRHQVGIENSELCVESKIARNPSSNLFNDESNDTGNKVLSRLKTSSNRLSSSVEVHTAKVDSPRKKLGNSTCSLLGVVPQSERSKQILSSWGSTEKSIGERSQRLLQTIRSMREKKTELLDKTDTDQIDSECESFISKSGSIKIGGNKSVGKYENNKNMENNVCSLANEKETCVEQKEDANIRDENQTMTEKEFGVEGSGIDSPMKENSVDSESNHISKPSLDDHDSPNVEEVQETNGPDEMSTEKVCNKFVLVHPPLHGIEEPCKNQEVSDSDTSSPSLENVTTASMDSLPAEDKPTDQTEQCLPSRPSEPRSRVSSAGSSGRCSRRDQMPERPPSRKPYFTRNSTDDTRAVTSAERDSHQPRRVTSSGSSRLTQSNSSQGPHAKKPPASRMYSTLKETPFSVKESLKMAIDDFNSKTKSNFKMPQASLPPSVKSSPASSLHNIPKETVSVSRPSTAMTDLKPSGLSLMSKMSPGSLRILKLRAKMNQEMNNIGRFSVIGKNLKGNNPDSSKSSPAFDRQAYLKKRIASLSKPSTPEIAGNSENQQVQARSRTRTCTNKNFPKTTEIVSALKSAKKSGKEQHRVTFANDTKTTASMPPKKSLLTQRLQNYKPPWERVDLRPPERALAERARHERRLFGEERCRGSRASSVSSRPQSPKVRNRSKESNACPKDPKTPETRTKQPNSSELRRKEVPTLLGPSQEKNTEHTGRSRSHIRDRTSEELRHEGFERDYIETASRRNSSNYDTATSSAMQHTETSTNSLYHEDSTPIRRPSVNSDDSKTYRTNSVQTLGVGSKRSKLTVNVSVKTALSASDVKYRH